MGREPITVQVELKVTLDVAWDVWTDPKHITNWAFASDDWEAPSAENDLRVVGKFKTVMAAKDGSVSFDFEGTYTELKENELIEYEMSDGRSVKISFKETEDGILVTEIFDPENENPEKMQEEGWQSILNNYKRYAEGI